MSNFPFPTDEELRNLLDMDAGQLAENITGKSYKTDKATSDLMMYLHIQLGEMKSDAMKEVGDVYWGCSFEHALHVAKSEGFKEAGRWDITRKQLRDEPIQTDVCVVMHSDEGLYLLVESYGTHYVGEGKGPNGSSYSGETGLNTIQLIYNLEMDGDLSKRIIEEGDIRDEWDVRHKDDWFEAENNEKDPKPMILTPEEEELRIAFLSNQGNLSWNDDTGEIITTRDSYDCRQGLSIILRAIRQETSWKICKKLKVWEFFACLSHWPESYNKDNGCEGYDQSSKEWLTYQLTLLGDEHQYLADVPRIHRRGTSYERVEKKKALENKS